MNRVIRHIKDGTLFRVLWNRFHPNRIVLRIFKLPHVYNYLEYKRQFGLLKSIKNPKTFSQKIYYLRDKYNENHLATQVSDKLEVRKYVESLGLGHILNELIAVYDSAEEINFESLPDQFVMKTNHASGTNIIVKDKSRIDEKAILKKLDKWLKKNYAFSSGELQYLNIKPKIIVEKYLEDIKSPNEDLIDYKFWCINGEPIFLYLRIIDKSVLEGFKLIGFDMEFKKSNYLFDTVDQKLLKPKSFDEMKIYAAKLSRDFKFARVDFYDINNKVIFGEITLTPTGGNNWYLTSHAQEELGKKINLKA